MSATIRDYIRRDLSARLRTDQVPPANLTLTALARFYGVSFTPVREAFRLLVNEGVLVKADNGRVRINQERSRSTPETTSQPPAERPDGPEALVSALSEEVIVRSLRGDSGYLREEATALRYGVGRTAIRQAFGRLFGQGLVVHVPRCGWRIRAFDAADLKSYLDVRECLELKALELARPRLDVAALKRLRAGNVAEGRSPRLDNALHREIVEKAGNPYIREFFERQGAYYTTLFDYAAPETHVVEAMARQHRVILNALIDQDWPRARRALAEHIRDQRPVVEKLLRQLGHPDLAPPTPKDSRR